LFKLTDLTNTNINNYEPKNEENINFNNSYIKNKNFLAQEMEKDNIKLGSALTLEKSKVVQLLNLLKIKENEINNLKQQIDNFEDKINEIKNKYQDIINSMKQEQNNKLNELYNKLTNENNRLQMDLNENKKNNELLLDKYNNELNKNEKMLKIFFDFFNKNIEVYKKTEILKGENLVIKEKDYSEDKATLAIETWDKLINKLFQDNKDLYNELVRLKGEIGNYDIIMNQNTNFIQQENDSLKKLVDKLSFENKILKSKINTKNNQLNNTNNNQHHHIVHSICRHCSNNNFEQNNKNRNNKDVSPIQKLRLKINHLENQIKNKSFI
jgi:DNA repair exonuclease SbcCD ATPase subunit